MYLLVYCISDEEMERVPVSPYDGMVASVRFDKISDESIDNVMQTMATKIKRELKGELNG